MFDLTPPSIHMSITWHMPIPWKISSVTICAYCYGNVLSVTSRRGLFERAIVKILTDCIENF